MATKKTLAALQPGERAEILRVLPGGHLYRRLLDIGLIEGTIVECIGESPLGDPKAYLIRGAVIAIRKRDAEGVSVCPSLPMTGEI